MNHPELSPQELADMREYLELVVPNQAYSHSSRTNAKVKLRLIDMVQRRDARIVDLEESLRQNTQAAHIYEQGAKEIQKRDKALALMRQGLEDVREQLALMTEGEGEDPVVYMEMSRAGMVKCDDALAAADRALKGE